MTLPMRRVLSIAALVVLTVADPLATHAAKPRAGRKPSGAVAETGEPALLKKLMAAHWQLASARAALPPVQLVHNEALEIQDFIQYAFDGGALRLCVSPGPKGGDSFALLVDTRAPRYASFTKLASTEHYTTYHRGAYVVVLPLQPVSQQVFERLLAKQWTADELEQQLGAPSYHWHVHGTDHLGLTYIPQGLAFIGDPATPVTYQLHAADVEDAWREQHHLDLSLPPVRSLSELIYLRVQTESREEFAKELLSQRERIDAALARGKRSADGRFVAGHANLAGGMANAEEVVIREANKPEQRYRAPHFINDKGYLWLNPRTVVFQVHVAGPAAGVRGSDPLPPGSLRVATSDRLAEFYTIDALTGAMTLVAKVPDDGLRPVTDFGVSGPQQFWYKTAAGEIFDVTVPSPKPHVSQKSPGSGAAAGRP